MKGINLQMFSDGYDSGAYCDFSSSAAKVIAGKDILLAVWDSTGAKLMAVSGQQGLTINRSADSIEITSKDTQGGWKSKIAGMKEWSIDNDGLYVPDHDSHKALAKAFDAGDPVCIKVVNGKTKRNVRRIGRDYGLSGRSAFDDAVTYSLTLEGMGALVDLIAAPTEPDTMPGANLSTANVE